MRKTIYWVSTSIAMCIMIVSGALAITHAPPMMRGLAHLGYPVYFANLLGVGKLIGVAVLLAPGLPRLKEWAYTGFGITVVSACYSHLCSGDGFMALDPLATLAALIISYRLRPENQRLENYPRPTGEQTRQMRSTISLQETVATHR
jgi:hypothetical protein